jgi:hypothetical protein
VASGAVLNKSGPDVLLKSNRITIPFVENKRVTLRSEHSILLQGQALTLLLQCKRSDPSSRFFYLTKETTIVKYSGSMAILSARYKQKSMHNGCKFAQCHLLRLMMDEFIDLAVPPGRVRLFRMGVRD